MATVGTGITHLTPSRGFAAQLATAATVVIASGTGLPISTTQTLVGAVMGVGLARGIAALNLGAAQHRGLLGHHPARWRHPGHRHLLRAADLLLLRRAAMKSPGH